MGRDGKKEGGRGGEGRGGKGEGEGEREGDWEEGEGSEGEREERREDGNYRVYLEKGKLVSLYNNVPFIFECFHAQQYSQWCDKTS